MGGSRYLRLIVFFDLPVETSAQRKSYRKFVKNLKMKGFLRIQYSVYSKLVMNHSVLNYHIEKLKINLPTKGLVQTLIVTEKQYADMQFLIGDPSDEYTLLTTERILEL